MKASSRVVLSLISALVALLLAGCATEKIPAPTPAPAPPAVAPPPPPPPAAPVPPPAPPVAPAPAPTPTMLEEEARQLTNYQKNYFDVFKLGETLAGLRQTPDAIGVFEAKAAKGGKLRMTVGLQPKAPVRPKIGSYLLTLDVTVDYVEAQECIAADCAGKRQNFVRSLNKALQLQISPQNKYYAVRDLPLPDTKGYRSKYSDVVLTVKRISVTASPRQD